MTRIKMFVQGYVEIAVSKELFSRFLTACSHRGIIIFQVRQSNASVSFCVSLKDLYSLHSLFLKFKMPMRILRRCGIPFLFRNAKRNWSYMVGFAACFFLLIYSSSFIWKIEFLGNIYHTDSTLHSFLSEWGHKTGMRVSDVEEETLELLIRNSFPDITWVSVTQSGTGLYVAVKEEVKQEKIMDSDIESYDLIAEDAGIISSIVTRTGVALVKAGDKVDVGQILVSGIIPINDDYGTAVGNQYVKADADIYLFQTIPYEHKTPLRYLIRESIKERHHYEIGISEHLFSTRPKGQKEDRLVFRQEIQPFFFDIIPFPFSIYKNRVVQYVETEQKRTKEEGILLEEKRLNTYLCKMEKMGVQIIEKNVKIGVSDNFSFAEGTFSIIKKLGIKQRIEKEETIGELTD